MAARLASSLRRNRVAAALYAALFLASLYPQSLRPWDTVAYIGDSLDTVYFMAWNAHQVVRDPLHLFDANILYPHPRGHDAGGTPHPARPPRSARDRPDRQPDPGLQRRPGRGVPARRAGRAPAGRPPRDGSRRRVDGGRAVRLQHLPGQRGPARGPPLPRLHRPGPGRAHDLPQDGRAPPRLAQCRPDAPPGPGLDVSPPLRRAGPGPGDGGSRCWRGHGRSGPASPGSSRPPWPPRSCSCPSSCPTCARRGPTASRAMRRRAST